VNRRDLCFVNFLLPARVVSTSTALLIMRTHVQNTMPRAMQKISSSRHSSSSARCIIAAVLLFQRYKTIRTMSSSSSTQRKDNVRYNELVLAALETMSSRGGRGDSIKRRAADKCIAATQAAPSKWADDRWYCFSSYCASLYNVGGKGIEATPADKKALKRIAKDAAEPALFRQQALFSLAMIALNENNYEKAANYFRLAGDAITEVIPSDRSRQVAVPSSEAKVVTVGVGSILETSLDAITYNLDKLESPERARNRHGIFECDELVKEEIAQRLVVGGAKCDCCGKDRREVEGGLFRCTKCKLSYYCSPACQQKQWKEGHKKCCLSPGEIKIGDYMTLRGLKSRTELNAVLVRVVAPSARAGRWQVSVLCLSETISVASERLFHIRPAK